MAAAVSDEIKIGWTEHVHAAIHRDAEWRVAYLPSIQETFRGVERWGDSRGGLFSAGWDSYQELASQLTRARNDAMIVTGRVDEDAAQSLEPASFFDEGVDGGFAEGAKDVRDGLAGVRDAVKSALPAVGVGTVVLVVVVLALVWHLGPELIRRVPKVSVV